MKALNPPPTKTEEFTFHWRNWLSFLYNFLQVEDWREIGDTGEPAFENSWVNAAGGTETAGFYKDQFGNVHLKGRIKLGTITAACFTLPEGYRPSLTRQFSCSANNAFGSLYITGGAVVPNSGSNTWFSLDGISFRV